MNEAGQKHLDAVRKFLAEGLLRDELADTTDEEVRTVVRGEVLAAMSQENVSSERARKFFADFGYLDEAVEHLRAGSSPADRANAARALGFSRNQKATPHLIAAMFDDNDAVREAAELALKEFGDTVNVQNLPKDETTSAVNDASSPENAIWDKERAPWRLVVASAKADVPRPAETEAPVAPEPPRKPETAVEVPTPAPSVADEREQQVAAKQQQLAEVLAEIEEQLGQLENKFAESAEDVRARIERETKLRNEASAQHHHDEELRKKAEEKAEARRAQHLKLLADEREARLKAQAQAAEHAQQTAELRLRAASLRDEAAETARERYQLELERHAADQSAHRDAVTHARNESRRAHEAEVRQLEEERQALETATAEVQAQRETLSAARQDAALMVERLKEEQHQTEVAHRAEMDRLRVEAERRNEEADKKWRTTLGELQRIGEDIAKRRSQVEAGKVRAQADAKRLLEAQERMRAAEETRALAEKERQQVEADIEQQIAAQRKNIEEVRRKGEEEQQRVEEQLRAQHEKEKQRLDELNAMKAKAEAESKALAEKERQILSQIDSIRITDKEARRRIADAEVRRRTAEEAYRSIAEKVQRVEAEAHARVKEEERMLEKLEAERRTVALEAQSRAEQEKRIRVEIEMFRRLEEEERPRLEEATLQLAQAEQRLHERKERLREISEAQAEIEDELARESEFSDRAQTVATPAAESVQVADAEQIESEPVSPAIATYLNSVDPYKRAAAVAELARTGSPDALNKIVECFDDHSPQVRNAAARALRRLEPRHTVDLFNRALENASATRRQNIGSAIAGSGVADDAINNLASDNREETYNALSILFVMAKSGEVEPLVRAVKEHGDDEIGRAVSKLLTLSGHNAGTKGAGGSQS